MAFPKWRTKFESTKNLCIEGSSGGYITKYLITVLIEWKKLYYEFVFKIYKSDVVHGISDIVSKL